ncbi:MAG TPA: hypothetical protein VEU51_03720, partial [Candidatus Acidoferrales bacterium]|nr:hypothetical protein [Candidatus Acidoferrales bacterium]
MPRSRVFATLATVMLSRIVIHFVDSAGAAQSLELAASFGAGEFSAALGSVAVTARLEHALGGTIVHATISNRGADAIALNDAQFEVATGIAPGKPARFFKHGYQSWSGSGAVEVDSPRTHPRDAANQISRINHQSEQRRPEHFPESHTSEMFTIVESSSSAERVMAGFVGARSALTTVTVTSPDRITARAILDGVTLAPRAHRELDPLFIVDANEPAAKLAARWAHATGRWMDARVGAPFQRGWCSWYHYFHAISEDALRANIKLLSAMRAE